jgi:hypothetical protein
LLERLKSLAVAKLAHDGSVTITVIQQATTALRNNWKDVVHTHQLTLSPDGTLDLALDITLGEGSQQLSPRRRTLRSKRRF